LYYHKNKKNKKGLGHKNKIKIKKGVDHKNKKIKK